MDLIEKIETIGFVYKHDHYLSEYNSDYDVWEYNNNSLVYTFVIVKSISVWSLFLNTQLISHSVGECLSLKKTNIRNFNFGDDRLIMEYFKPQLRNNKFSILGL